MDRRSALLASLAGALAPSFGRAQASSRSVNVDAVAKTFVLVAGAWHGGWCWRAVADILGGEGHRIYTPTLTGLGERRHLMSRGISLETFVEDLQNFFVFEDISDVILVGHSFGGLPITGLADRMPERIKRLIYLDSVILPSGVSFFSTLEVTDLAHRREVSRDLGLGMAMPPPPLSFLGIPETHPRAAWVRRQMTPHPIGTYETALDLHHPVGNGLSRTYIHCTEPSVAALEPTRAWVRQQLDWRWVELPTGHDAMVLAPDALSKLLLSLV